MKFPLSAIANQYLTGLKGVEIGGSAHNDFGLDTINVDYTDEMTVYKQQEIELCGEFMKVDVVADASKLPFADKSFDFVISSHSLEHLFDPISALEEWQRVAKQYIFVIVPRKDKTFDRDKPDTLVRDLYYRKSGGIKKPDNAPADDHWCVWGVESFVIFCLNVASTLKLTICEFLSVDDKVGNGMCVIFKIQN